MLSGNTVQFIATGIYSDNTTEDITDDVTWASSDTSVATISNTVGSKGLAPAIKWGTSTISATEENLGCSTKLTVTGNARRFYIDPDNEKLIATRYQLAPGIGFSSTYRRFVCTLHFSKNIAY